MFKYTPGTHNNVTGNSPEVLPFDIGWQIDMTAIFKLLEYEVSFDEGQGAEIFSGRKCKARTVVGRGGQEPAMWPRIWIVATRRERE